MHDQVAVPEVPKLQRVAPSRGFEWWKIAWRLLAGRGAVFVVWIAMIIIEAILCWLIGFLPVVGFLASNLASFVFTGGLMQASRETQTQAGPRVASLFSGFGPAFGSLVIAGLLVAIALSLVVRAITAAGIVLLFTALYAALRGNLQALTDLGLAAPLLIAAELTLLLPILMAAWLAPALIVFRRQPPIEALKRSLAASWANLAALSRYGLLGIGLAVIATLALGLGWLVLVPLSALSSYAAYRDLFEQS